MLAADTTQDLSLRDAAGSSRFALLRAAVIVAGIASAVLFVVVGLAFELQMYGDGSVFSYAVAVQDAWTIHLHNIPGRLLVYLYCFVPAEAFTAWSGNAHGGVVLYGFLHDTAPLLGLAATFAADRSKGRIIFSYACFSTACVCPLVFGFPTEMWMAHALFWSALAASHYARGIAGTVAVFMLLLALVLTHEGALVLAGVIVSTLLPRGIRDAAFLRGAASVAAVVAIWFVIKTVFIPDAYIADVMRDAEMNFFNVKLLAGNLILLLVAALAGYVLLTLALRRLTRDNADAYAGLTVAVLLIGYWLWLDRSLHTQDRYFLRTVLLLATSGLGMLAAAYALAADEMLDVSVPGLSRIVASVATGVTARQIAVAIALVMLVHAVETAKFVVAWSEYKGAVRVLAMGAASDPGLGDPRFVASTRIGAGLNRLSWSTTTPYLSILLAPRMAPARLVVDPDASYFWLSCEAAKENEAAGRAVPVESRRLVRILECLHRR